MAEKRYRLVLKRAPCRKKDRPSGISLRAIYSYLWSRLFKAQRVLEREWNLFLHKIWHTVKHSILFSGSTFLGSLASSWRHAVWTTYLVLAGIWTFSFINNSATSRDVPENFLDVFYAVLGFSTCRVRDTLNRLFFLTLPCGELFSGTKYLK